MKDTIGAYHVTGQITNIGNRTLNWCYGRLSSPSQCWAEKQ